MQRLGRRAFQAGDTVTTHVVELTQRRGGAGDHQRDAEGARQDRHRRQQRRHHRRERPDLGARPTGLAFDDVIEVNLFAPYPGSAGPWSRSMIAAGYGRIVNIASIAGKEGNPNASHYSASKGLSLIGLTQVAGQGAGHQGDHWSSAVTPPPAPDRDVRPDDPAAPSTTCCPKIPMQNRFVLAGRGRGDDRLAILGGLLLHHRLRCSTSPGGRAFY